MERMLRPIRIGDSTGRSTEICDSCGIIILHIYSPYAKEFVDIINHHDTLLAENAALREALELSRLYVESITQISNSNLARIAREDLTAIDAALSKTQTRKE